MDSRPRTTGIHCHFHILLQEIQGIEQGKAQGNEYSDTLIPRNKQYLNYYLFEVLL